MPQTFCGPYCCVTPLMVLAIAVGGCGENTSSHNNYAQLVAKLGGELHAHVELGGTQISNDELARLELPDTVRSISLRDSAITDLGAAELKRGLNLERIDLTNTQITDAALEDLKQMPRLWVVDVAAPNVSPEAFGEIRFFVDRRSSSIKHRCSFTTLPRLPLPAETAPIGPPEAAPVKIQVRLSGYAKEIESLDGELQIHLDFSDAQITDDELASLSFTDSVRSISLRGTGISDRGVKELERARNLERVDLRGTQATDKVAETLKGLPRLWEANVGSTKMTAKGQRQLAGVLSRKRAAVEYDVSRAVDPATTMPKSLRTSR